MQKPSAGHYWVSLVILLGATLAATRTIDSRGLEPLARPLEEIPDTVNGWVASPSRTLDPEVDRVLGATAYLHRVYSRGDWALELFVAYYGQQRAGEAMHSPKNCLPGSGWEIWRHELAEVATSQGNLQINRYSIQNGVDRRIVLYWYQTQDRIFAGEFAGKAYLIWDAVVNGHRSGSIVRVILPDREGAAAAGLEFSAQIVPAVEACLSNSRLPRAAGGKKF